MCIRDRCYSDGIKLAEDTRRIAGREVQFLPSTRRIGRVRSEPPRAAAPYRLLFLGRWHPNKGIDLPVSYTHLDVYKRQTLYVLISYVAQCMRMT